MMNPQAEIEKYRLQLELYKIKIEQFKAEAEMNLFPKIVFCTVEQTTDKYTFLAERSMSGTATRYSTMVKLEDGSSITVSMDFADAMKIQPEAVSTIFWDVPCQNGGNTAPRTLSQVQDCRCVVCQAACATILKWRMTR